METACCSPRGARRGAPCSRLRRNASPSSLSGGADVPKRPALSPRRAGVSMVSSQALSPFCTGDLEPQAAGVRFGDKVWRSFWETRQEARFSCGSGWRLALVLYAGTPLGSGPRTGHADGHARPSWRRPAWEDMRPASRPLSRPLAGGGVPTRPAPLTCLPRLSGLLVSLPCYPADQAGTQSVFLLDDFLSLGV